MFEVAIINLAVIILVSENLPGLEAQLGNRPLRTAVQGPRGLPPARDVETHSGWFGCELITYFDVKSCIYGCATLADLLTERWPNSGPKLVVSRYLLSMPHQHDRSKQWVGLPGPYLWSSFRPTIDIGNEAVVDWRPHYQHFLMLTAAGHDFALSWLLRPLE